MQRFLVCFLGFFVVFMSGCSMHQQNQQFTHTPQVYSGDFDAIGAVISQRSGKANTNFAKSVSRGKKHAYLQRQYSKWAGTPYQYGGTSRSGIDCSALMMKVYNEAFGRSLPRTTAQQVKLGKAVSQKRLKVGDLVFFKTGRNQRHVGVFMGGDQFLHASVSSGVIVSRLADPYWRSRYWQSRRIL